MDISTLLHADSIVAVLGLVGILAILFAETGLLIGLVSSHLGLAAEGGTRAVGSATVRAVVNVTVGVLVLDYLVGEVFRRGWPPPPF